MHLVGDYDGYKIKVIQLEKSDNKDFQFLEENVNFEIDIMTR